MEESPDEMLESPHEVGGDVGKIPRVVVIMGASGAGKTKLGRMLATRSGHRFLDADDFHSLESKEKMARGEGLDDAERRPWLARLEREIEAARTGDPLVLACSALKARYREVLGVDGATVVLRYLRVSPPELARRLGKRRGHFANEALLPSQLATLEEPSEAETIDAEGPVELVFDALFASLAGRLTRDS